ncbi:hypothetical protein D030_2629A, partial [Vibrio parahaemolyticus AQ3810]
MNLNITMRISIRFYL